MLPVVIVALLSYIGFRVYLAFNLAPIMYLPNQLRRPILFLFNLFREQGRQDEEEPRVEEGTRHLLPLLVARHRPQLSRAESESSLERNMLRVESRLEHSMPRAESESNLEFNMPHRRRGRGRGRHRHRRPSSSSSHIDIVVNEPRPEAPPQCIPNYIVVLIGGYWMCGTPYLSAPYAMQEGGWMSLCFLVVVSVFSAVSSVLLGMCLTAHTTSYEDVVANAFGQIIRHIVEVMSNLLAFITCMGIFIIQMDSLHYIWPEWGIWLACLLNPIFYLILCLYNVKEENKWTSGAGLFCVILVGLTLAVIWIINGPSIAQTTIKLNRSKIHRTIGLFIYFYCGHATLPVLYKALRDKSHYTMIVIFIFTITTALYGGIAIIGYGMFGSEVKPVVTQNLSRDSGLSYFAVTCVVFDHIIKYMVNITPVAVYFDRVLPVGGRVLNRTSRKLQINFMLVFISILPAAFYKVDVNNEIYAELLTIVGATIGVLMAFVIPSLCYLRIIGWNGIRHVQGNLAFLTLAVGVVGGAIMMWKSVEDFIN